MDLPADLSTCFTSHASTERSETLHRSYRERMRGHFLNGIASAGEGLMLPLDHLRKRVEKLDPAKRFAPGAYESMTRLVGALQSGKITAVCDALKHLETVPDAELFDTTFRIESASSEAWERSIIATARHEAPGGEDGGMILRPLLEADPGHRFTSAFTALQYLKQIEPELAAEFDDYVTRVKLFNGKGFLGFSSPRAFGAIYMRLPEANPVEYFLEHLVHELSHLDLNLLMAHDPLLENPGDMHAAPLREEERPLFQVLHATYVLNRNVRVTRKLVAEGTDLDCGAQLEEFERDYANGYREIEEHARWTDRGRAVFESFETPA